MSVTDCTKHASYISLRIWGTWKCLLSAFRWSSRKCSANIVEAIPNCRQGFHKLLHQSSLMIFCLASKVLLMYLASPTHVIIDHARLSHRQIKPKYILYSRFAGKAENLTIFKSTHINHWLESWSSFWNTVLMSYSCLVLLNGQLGNIHICFHYVAIHILNLFSNCLNKRHLQLHIVTLLLSAPLTLLPLTSLQ